MIVVFLDYTHLLFLHGRSSHIVPHFLLIVVFILQRKAGETTGFLRQIMTNSQSSGRAVNKPFLLLTIHGMLVSTYDFLKANYSCHWVHMECS